jgi:hypothetical protein
MYLKANPDDGDGDPNNDDVVCADDPSAFYWRYAMLHDVLHVMGFVAPCAPNFGTRTHVTDDPTDLMYSREDAHPDWDPPWTSTAATTTSTRSRAASTWPTART